MSKHTPSPWRLEIDGWNSQSIYGHDTQAKREIYIADVSLDWASSPANAYLIAAAPDLLEALVELRNFYIEMTGLPPVAANEAIAKAKGEQP
jgi:hypothetical protein